MAIPNKSPLKILEKMERGHIQGLSKFFGYPLLSRERIMLRTSNLASIFTGPIRIKAHKSFGEKGVCRHIPGAAKYFGYPLLSLERVKLQTSNFVGKFKGLSEQKPMKNFGNSSQGVPKIHGK